VLDWIGAYGVAVIVLTVIIRLILAPLQQFQLVTQRKSMVEQRKVAPQIAELRKKYKKDPQRLQAETMKLYQEHGVNPLGGFIGCLPLIVQLPILTALFYVFTGFAHRAEVAAHFLWIPNLNDNPNHHLLIHGLPIPDLAYLVFPLLAAVTTLVQSRMLQMPPNPNPSEQEQQTQQMQRTMVWISPLMIGWFALNVPQYHSAELRGRVGERPTGTVHEGRRGGHAAAWKGSERRLQERAERRLQERAWKRPQTQEAREMRARRERDEFR
jgi:YidC/Oxa1 family membrane protein insertase